MWFGGGFGVGEKKKRETTVPHISKYHSMTHTKSSFYKYQVRIQSTL